MKIFITKREKMIRKESNDLYPKKYRGNIVYIPYCTKNTKYQFFSITGERSHHLDTETYLMLIEKELKNIEIIYEYRNENHICDCCHCIRMKNIVCNRYGCKIRM
jgi:hypothetical protein